MYTNTGIVALAEQREHSTYGQEFTAMLSKRVRFGNKRLSLDFETCALSYSHSHPSSPYRFSHPLFPQYPLRPLNKNGFSTFFFLFSILGDVSFEGTTRWR